MAVETATERQLGREAAVAMRAVAEAIDLVRQVERHVAAGVLSKSDASPVTVADFGVQTVVAARLSRDFPSDPLVAEEDASVLRTSPDVSARVVDLVRCAGVDRGSHQVWDLIDRGRGKPGRRCWTLDPIDGTKGLLRGGQYAIALALIVDGAVQLGVLGCPRLSLARRSTGDPASLAGATGGVAVAVRGCGAWWSAGADATLVRLSVSCVSDATRARVLHSFERSHSDVKALQRVIHSLGVSRPPSLMDSQAKHVVIAGAVADILLRFPPRGFHDAIWDQAAGSILIEEAGGRVTDLAGRALDFSTGRHLSRNDGLIATNGVLHESVVEAVQRAR